MYYEFMALGNVSFILSIIFALSLGLFIFLKPQQTFIIQKKFYECINWRIEPISFEKELRNTRLMGLFLIVFVFGVCFYVLFFSKH